MGELQKQHSFCSAIGDFGHILLYLISFRTEEEKKQDVMKKLAEQRGFKICRLEIFPRKAYFMFL